MTFPVKTRQGWKIPNPKGGFFPKTYKTFLAAQKRIDELERHKRL